jgi:outer membrane protein TolC
MPLHLLDALLLASTAAPPRARGEQVPPEVKPTPGSASASRSSRALSLDEALGLAAQANADLLSARADAAASRADRGEALSRVLPQLGMTSSWGRNFVGASQVRTLSLGGVTFPVGGGPASDTAAYAFDLQLSQILFDWQHFQATGQAGWSARAADRRQEEAALAVAFTVTQRFYDVVEQERSLQVLEKSRLRSKELVDRADALFAAGRAPRSDTYAARVSLQTDRINVEAQRIRVTQARTALARALGRSDLAAVAVVAPAVLDAPPPLLFGEPPALEVLLARARERRPSLAARAAQVEAARAGVSAARGEYLPSVSAQATYARGGQDLNGREGIYGDPTRAYSATAQLVLSWGLFQGLGTVARVRRAEAALAGARAAERGAREALSEEVANARAAVVALAKAVALAVENLSVAREALKLATQRFVAGLASQLEERDASLKLSQAELTLLQTRIDHAVALADLARAVGGAL